MPEGTTVKILHYLHGLPPARDGGLIKYALDLAQGEVELGNDVQLLVPGGFNRWFKGQTVIKSKTWRQFPCHFIINPLPVTEGKRIGCIEPLLKHNDIAIFVEFLKRVSPAVIHLHSLMGIECTFLEAAQKLEMPIVFTTHDYYGLCPKVNLFGDGQNCGKNDWYKCASCMGDAISESKIIWHHSSLYRALKTNKIFHWLEYSPKVLPYKIYVKKTLSKTNNIAMSIGEKDQDEAGRLESLSNGFQPLHEYYMQMYKNITCFHFNSRQSRGVFESYLGKVRGEVIPITNRRIKDNRRRYEYSGKLKVGYLGTGQQFKGYQYMKEALDEMYESGETEFECHVYFNSQDFSCPYLYCHEPYEEEKIGVVFQNMDILVVPSLCRETFGMVVLEALSYGVPVIVSSFVGAKELLVENRGIGIVFDPDQNSNELRIKLEEIYKNRDLLSQMNKKICEWDYEWDYGKHVVKMMNLYSKLG